MSREARRIPEVMFVTALKPVESESRLTYPELNKQIKCSYVHMPNRWEQFELAQEGGLDEESFARDLACHYLLESARKLTEAPNSDSKQLWSERFNQASVELFGEIDREDLGSLASSQLTELELFDEDGEISSIYKEIASQTVAEQDIDFETLRPFTDALLERADFVAEIINGLPDAPYEMPRVRRVFRQAIKQLKSENQKWKSVKVDNPENDTSIMVFWEKGEARIPDGRTSINSKDELLGIVVHELLWHLQRSVNGATIAGDDSSIFATGQMPDYLEFEEGAGKLFETLIIGKMPDVTADRYIDTALALGVIDGIRMNRHELIDFAVKRESIRCRARGISFDETSAKSAASSHINRIFRGSDGEPVMDEEGIITQGVFVKDILYYKGLKKAARYIGEQLDLGTDPKQLLEYLCSGKFDPTNEKHVNYVRQLGILDPSVDN